MDIYEQAEMMNADYYDFHTGYIYKIQEWYEVKKTNPDARIRVVDSMTGETIGFARRNED